MKTEATAETGSFGSSRSSGSSWRSLLLWRRTTAPGKGGCSWQPKPLI